MLAKKKKLEDRFVIVFVVFLAVIWSYRLHKKREEAERANKRQHDNFRGSYDEEDDGITAAALERQEQESRDKVNALEKVSRNGCRIILCANYRYTRRLKPFNPCCKMRARRNCISTI